MNSGIESVIIEPGA
jgi:hypothetical protein